MQVKDPNDVLKSDVETLEREINNIVIRQQELQNLISTIETNIHSLDSQILAEENKAKKDYNRLKSLRGALTQNIELMNQLYNSYKGFEDVKFKYRKLITDTNIDYQKLIRVQIRQVEEKLQKDDDGSLIKNLKILTEQLVNQKNTSILDDSKQELINDPAYML